MITTVPSLNLRVRPSACSFELCITDVVSVARYILLCCLCTNNIIGGGGKKESVFRLITKELNVCYNLKFSNPNNFAGWWRANLWYFKRRLFYLTESIVSRYKKLEKQRLWQIFNSFKTIGKYFLLNYLQQPFLAFHPFPIF